MRCEMCAYCWKEEEDRYPICHWESRCPGDYPPCEEIDMYVEDERYWEE